MADRERFSHRMRHHARKGFVHLARKYYGPKIEGYLEENGLSEVINTANSASGSTGADSWDYAVLYETIRRLRPQYVLECGTGKSTWVIAQAMLDHCYERYDGKIRLVSMEDQKQWFEQASEILPDKYREITEITHSPLDHYNYTFVIGTVYKDVPDYPYDFIFVDGPCQEGMCNMEFVRQVEKSDKPIAGLIDRRLPTTKAYGVLFGKDKVSYNPTIELGIVRPVTRQDLEFENNNFVSTDVLKTNLKIEYQGFKSLPLW